MDLEEKRVTLMSSDLHLPIAEAKFSKNRLRTQRGIPRDPVMVK